MSERFEQEIQKWYDTAQIANLEYITFEKESPNPKLSDCINNIACTYNRLSLFCKVSLKNYKNILENQSKLEILLKENIKRVEDCEENIRKTNRETIKSLQQISQEIQTNKPLTKSEIQSLVRQPQLVEEGALKELKIKVQRVEDLLKEVKELIAG